MSIFDNEHDRFRTAVVRTMIDIATTASLVYDDDEQRQEYVENAIDVAFSTILNCFDNDMYASLTDTVCRRLAKSEIYDAINDSTDRKSVASSIDAESVFEDIDEMQDDDEDE